MVLFEESSGDHVVTNDSACAGVGTNVGSERESIYASPNCFAMIRRDMVVLRRETRERIGRAGLFV